jgi:hypothetical protein
MMYFFDVLSVKGADVREGDTVLWMFDGPRQPDWRDGAIGDGLRVVELVRTGSVVSVLDGRGQFVIAFGADADMTVVRAVS